MRTFEIQVFGRSTRVLDDLGRVAFAGSFRECEDWLDHHEVVELARKSARAKAAKRPNWPMRVLKTLTEAGRNLEAHWPTQRSRSV